MSLKKSKIYTKRGDSGETSLVGGERVKKSDTRVEAYGTVDELNASLGVVAAQLKSKELLEIIETIQNELFNIGAELSAVKKLRKGKDFYQIAEAKVEQLETWIDRYDARLYPLREFILPGGTKEASFFHLARTICRRAEREVSRLNEVSKVNPVLLKYLNRLSDLLFVLARTTNDGADIVWKKD